MPRNGSTTSLLAIGTLMIATNGWASGECERDALGGRKLWISSAVWGTQQEKVLLVDSVRDGLLLYNPGTQQFTSVLDASTGKPYPFPASVARQRDGYVLNLLDSKMLLLGRDLHAVGTRQLASPATVSKEGIGSIYDWAVTDDGNLFAYGAVLRKGSTFTMGFFSAPLSAPARAEIVHPFERYAYYTLGYPYVVAMGRDVYFLEMGREVSLLKFTGTSKVEPVDSALPQRFRSAPEFKTQIVGPDSAANLYKEIETFSLIVGLYSHENFLYLLARTPDGGGGTAWWLYQIDPTAKERHRLRGRLRLPSSSNHLTLVPASDYWLLFERGPVIAMGDQELRAALKIPVSWISEPHTSPLRRTSSTAGLCK